MFLREEIRPADMHDPFIFLIIIQELLTEGEKRCVRQAVILEDNCFICEREKLVQTAVDPLFQTQVCFAEVGGDRTIPIHLINDRTGLLAALKVVRTILARAVCNDVKPGWAR